MQIKLSKLKQINLRTAWNHEASDFTNWLAEDENLILLSDEIGIDIKLIQTEANVGKFNVDIFAEEENTGRKIIVENQLEATDHDHLGKLITYASGLDAEIIVWIVKNAREEHQQAIDWLNEHSDQEINFFLIKMELWQIGDSDFAPKFQKISEPNDWAKAVKKTTTQANLTDTKAMQFDFWTKFKEYANNKGTKLKLRKVSPQHWYDISFGNSDAHIALTVNSRENLIACEIYINDSKELFYELEKNKDRIESKLGEKLRWMVLEGKKASRIKLSIEADINEVEQWDKYFEWLKVSAEKLDKVFGKEVKQLRN